MATIQDVCRVSGVSIATVSRVINGAKHVKQATREHVEAVMKQLNYRPSTVAQTLATSKSNNIGLVISDFEGDYYGSLLKQASVSSDRMRKNLFIVDGHNSADGELRAVQSLEEKKCAVIMLYSRMCSKKSLEELVSNIDTPIIHFGRKLPKKLGCSISFDHARATYDATTFLINSGHKNIIYVGPPPKTVSRTERLAGFNKAAKEFQEINARIIHAEYSMLDGYVTFYENFRKSIMPYTAIMAASDAIAVGIIRACNELNLHIPEDVSIISIDNETIGEFISPKLTTIHVPIKDMTEYAMTVVSELLQNENTLPSKTFYGDLIIRQSTKNI